MAKILDWFRWFRSPYKSEAQMRRQAIEWVVKVNEGSGKSAIVIQNEAQILLFYWILGDGNG